MQRLGPIGEHSEDFPAPHTKSPGGLVTRLFDSSSGGSGGSSAAASDQPPPAKGKVRVLDLVVKDLQDRAEVGRERYGTYLETENGRDALMDAYQEALDLTMYLRQVIEERDIAVEMVGHGLVPRDEALALFGIDPGYFDRDGR